MKIKLFIILFVVSVSFLSYKYLRVEIDHESYEVAQLYNQQIIDIRKRVVTDDADQIFNMIWSDRNIKNFYKKVTGIIEGNHKTEVNVDDFIQFHLISQCELESVYRNLILKFRVSAMEALRDKAVENNLEVYPRKAMPILEKNPGELGRTNFITSDFIKTDFTKVLTPILSKRTLKQKIGFSNKEGFRQSIKEQHRKVFYKKLEEILVAESKNWLLPKTRPSYAKVMFKFNLKPDYEAYDNFISLVERNLVKAKIGDHVTAYSRDFLRNEVNSDSVQNFREIFYGPFDVIRTFYVKNTGENEFKQFANRKFSDKVFTPNQYQELCLDLSDLTTREIKAGVMEYLMNVQDNQLFEGYENTSNTGHNKNQQFANISVNKKDTVLSIVDSLDTGIVAGQILILAGIIAAPETGGLSLVISIAGIVWDACVLAKDFFINPSHELVQVVELKNNVQLSIFKNFNPHKGHKNFLEGSYKQVDLIFDKLEQS